MAHSHINADILKIIRDLSSSQESADAKIKNPNSIESKMLAAASAFRHYLVSRHSIIEKAVSLIALIHQLTKSGKRHKHEQFSSSEEAFEEGHDTSSPQRLKKALEKIDLALEKLDQMRNELIEEFDDQKTVLRQATVTAIVQNIQTVLGTPNHTEFNQALGQSLLGHYATRELQRPIIMERIRQVAPAQTGQSAEAKFDVATQVQSMKIVTDHIEAFGLNIKPSVRETVGMLNNTDKMIKFLDQVISKLTEDYKTQHEQANEAIKGLKSQRDSLLSQSPELKPGHGAHRKAAEDHQEGIASSSSSIKSPGATPTLNLGRK